MSFESSIQPKSRIPSLAVYADTLETVHGAILGGCRRVYFEPFIGQIQVDRSKETLNLLYKAKDICRDAELIWKWPKITKEEYLRFAEPLLDKIKVDGVMVENIAAAEAVLAADPNANLFGGSGLNVWNHLTIEQLSPLFRLLTLSPELSRDQLTKTISASQLCRNAPRLELIMQGNLEVMVAEDCIPCLAKGKTMPDRFWGLQDFKHVFPIRQDDDKRTHVFNSAETCLLDFMPEIFKMGIDGVAVDARGRTKKYAKEMTEIYIKAINLTKKGGGSLQEELRGLKEYIRPMALGGLTFGHFVKGLKDEIS
jgi:putative protease